ncbi:MAG: FHA domain-containing protein [Patescibacteria group bacterium]
MNNEKVNTQQENLKSSAEIEREIKAKQAKLENLKKLQQGLESQISELKDEKARAKNLEAYNSFLEAYPTLDKFEESLPELASYISQNKNPDTGVYNLIPVVKFINELIIKHYKANKDVHNKLILTGTYELNPETPKVYHSEQAEIYPPLEPEDISVYSECEENRKEMIEKLNQEIKEGRNEILAHNSLQIPENCTEFSLVLGGTSEKFKCYVYSSQEFNLDKKQPYRKVNLAFLKLRREPDVYEPAQTFQLNKSEVTIGRSTENKLVTVEDETKVSNNHLQIDLVGDQIVITDNSTNGTKVNLAYISHLS